MDVRSVEGKASVSTDGRKGTAKSAVRNAFVRMGGKHAASARSVEGKPLVKSVCTRVSVKAARTAADLNLRAQKGAICVQRVRSIVSKHGRRCV